MIEESKRTQLQCQFASTLDTVLKRDEDEVSYVAKLTLLTSKHMVLSETQLLDNRGIREFLSRRSVRQFLKAPDLDGIRPIIACVPSSASFEEFLKSMLHREKPMIFSSLSEEQNDEIQHHYGRGKTPGLGHFYDICAKGGENFSQHLRHLEEVFDRPEDSRLKSRTLIEEYPALVSQAVEVRKSALRTRIAQLKLSNNVEPMYVSSTEKQYELCGQVEKALQGEGLNINRSVLYDKINKSEMPEPLKELIKRQVLDHPYNQNIAIPNGFHYITGDEYRSSSLWEGDPIIAKKVEELRAEEFGTIPCLPVSIEQIDFETIARIRDSHSFARNLENLCNPTSDKSAFLREHFSFLVGELQLQPKGLKKLLRRFTLDEQTKAELAESGFSVGDVATYLVKGGTFVISEAVGWWAGVPLVGGLIGLGLENAFESTFIKPHKERELKHVLSLLTLKAGVT